MSLPDPKALKELLKILRSQGVLTFNSPELSLVLSETLPQPIGKKSSIEEVMGQEDEDPVLEIERLIDYSSKSPIEDL